MVVIPIKVTEHTTLRTRTCVIHFGGPFNSNFGVSSKISTSRISISIPIMSVGNSIIYIENSSVFVELSTSMVSGRGLIIIVVADSG